MTTPPPASTPELSSDAALALGWLQRHFQGGRPPVFSVLELARGMFGRTDSPVPGSTFEPTAWGRVRQALDELAQMGLVEHGRLPQGDFGYRLTAGGLPHEESS